MDRTFVTLAYTLCMALGPSGCFGNSGGYASTLHEFEAEIEIDGTQLHLRLEAPNQIRDRTGAWRLAHKLEVTATDGSPHATYFLDGSFHIVRQDFPCAGAPCDRYTATAFFYEGKLAPFGIGWDAEWLRAGHLVDTAARSYREIPLSGIEDGRTLTLAIESGTDYAGEYVYRAGRMLPHGSVNIISYVDLGPIAAAEIWPPPILESAAPMWTHSFFPGSEADDFGIGFGHAEFLQAVVDQYPNARQAIQEGGCVEEYSLNLLAAQQDADPLVSQQASATLVIVDATGTTFPFVVHASKDLIGSKNFDVTPNGPGSTGKPVCAAYRSGPDAVVSVADGRALIEKLGIDHQGTESFFLSHYDLSQLTGRPANASHVRFGLTFVPTHVNLDAPQLAWQGYVAELDPATGWLEAVTAGPGDIDAE